MMKNHDRVKLFNWGTVIHLSRPFVAEGLLVPYRVTKSVLY